MQNRCTGHTLPTPLVLSPALSLTNKLENPLQCLPQEVFTVLKHPYLPCSDRRYSALQGHFQALPKTPTGPPVDSSAHFPFSGLTGGSGQYNSGI